MKAVGLIVEYNPFHKGHQMHLREIEASYPEAVKIAVMSGDYVQRGEPALLSKERRAKMALEEGLDLIVELPAFYSTQSAEIFAKASVGILTQLACEAFVFGSESNDMPRLQALAEKSESKEVQKLLGLALQEGLSYPSAFAKALGGERMEANDILGIEYLKALRFWKSHMRAESIERKGSNYYEENVREEIAGASKIREKIFSGETYANYLPEGKNLEAPFLSWEDCYPYLRQKLLFSGKDLLDIQDMEVGLEQRLLRAASACKDFSSFLSFLKTKRYTQARLQRICLHILLSLSKEMTARWKEELPYIHILAYNKRGQTYLNQIKKSCPQLLSTKKNIKKKLSKEAQEIFFWNEKASQFYTWMTEEKK